jgi:hypothetical protein
MSFGLKFRLEPLASCQPLETIGRDRDVVLVNEDFLGAIHRIVRKPARDPS